MNDISIGAVGAAVIAGLVSLLGLIIGKEQKVSEFRQAWIDDLRKCLVSYLVNINAISDFIRSSQGKSQANEEQLKNYKALNEANHGIRLRVNVSEDPAKNLLSAMDNFEKIAQNNNNLTPDKIKELEDSFLESAKNLLKFEWKRVKEGEPIYILTKRILIFLVVIMLIIFCVIWYFQNDDRIEDKKIVPQSQREALSCSYYAFSGKMPQVINSFESNNSIARNPAVSKTKAKPQVCVQKGGLQDESMRESVVVNSSD